MPWSWHGLGRTRAVAFPVRKNAWDTAWMIVCRCGRGMSLFCWWSVIENKSGSPDEIHGWWDTQNLQRQCHKSHTSQVMDYCLFCASSSSCCSPQPCWPRCISHSFLFLLSPPFLHHPPSPRHQPAYLGLRTPCRPAITGRFGRCPLLTHALIVLLQHLLLLQNGSPHRTFHPPLSLPIWWPFMLRFVGTQGTISTANGWTCCIACSFDRLHHKNSGMYLSLLWGSS